MTVNKDTNQQMIICEHDKGGYMSENKQKRFKMFAFVLIVLLSMSVFSADAITVQAQGPQSSITFTAPEKWTVNFWSNWPVAVGGSNSVVAGVFVSHGDILGYARWDESTISLIPPPGGFRFLGWSIYATGHVAFDANTPVYRNINLFAIWVLEAAPIFPPYLPLPPHMPLPLPPESLPEQTVPTDVMPSYDGQTSADDAFLDEVSPIPENLFPDNAVIHELPQYEGGEYSNLGDEDGGLLPEDKADVNAEVDPYIIAEDSPIPLIPGPVLNGWQSGYELETQRAGQAFFGTQIMPFAGERSWALLNLLLTIIGLTVYVIKVIHISSSKKGKEAQVRHKVKKKQFIVMLAMAALSPILFMLTQDLTGSTIVWMDWWTIAHTIILGAQQICSSYAPRKQQKPLLRNY